MPEAASSAEVQPQVGVDPAASAAGPRPSPAYGIYVTVMLALITMLSIADRNIFSILLVPVQRDLGVSDAAMGALTGLSFTLVYATVALPMARLADTGTRRNIVAASLAVWSLMTAVCGMATNYVTLLFARMGVAAGEASAHPSIMSMVGDLFPPHRRGAALAFITLGSALGTGLGAYVAGALSEAYSWHVAFMALGAPGLLLAILFLLTVKEPIRGLYEGGDRPEAAKATWRDSMAYLVSIRSFRALVVGQIFVGLVYAIYLSWMPTYLVRVQGMPVSEMSFWFGMTVAPSLAGIMIGGFFTDRLVTNGARWRPISVAGMLLFGIPTFLILLAARNNVVVLTMMFIYAFFIGSTAALGPAATLDVVQPRVRGTMTAVSGFCASVLGGGLGPILLGLLNDAVKDVYGDQSLRYTLLVLPVFLAIAAAAFLVASRSTDRDAAAARNEPAAQ
jgi:MFS family permease